MVCFFQKTMVCKKEFILQKNLYAKPEFVKQHCIQAQKFSFEILGIILFPNEWRKVLKIWYLFWLNNKQGSLYFVSFSFLFLFSLIRIFTADKRRRILYVPISANFDLCLSFKTSFVYEVVVHHVIGLYMKLKFVNKN